MYDSKFKSIETDDLFAAILSLENEEECYRFFEDLMTIKELQAVTQRWQVARMLDEKKTYGEIEAATKASAATISRVNKCLQYGAAGYTAVLKRMKEGVTDEK
jgi:TrpR-related protein YerC/YecD